MNKTHKLKTWKKPFPKNWPEIRREILNRANDRCEWLGCNVKNYSKHPITGSKVVLTVAHLNHKIKDVRRKKLKAVCQMHHNRHDVPHRVKNRKKTLMRKKRSQHK